MLGTQSSSHPRIIEPRLHLRGLFAKIDVAINLPHKNLQVSQLIIWGISISAPNRLRLGFAYLHDQSRLLRFQSILEHYDGTDYDYQLAVAIVRKRAKRKVYK